MTTGRGQVADREDRTEAEIRFEEEQAAAEAGLILPPEKAILPEPPPPPEPEPEVELPPSIITEEDVDIASKAGLPLPPPVTAEIKVGINTADPFTIKDKDVIESLQPVQSGEPQLFKTLIGQGITAFNRGVEKLKPLRRAEIKRQIKQETLREFERTINLKKLRPFTKDGLVDVVGAIEAGRSGPVNVLIKPVDIQIAQDFIQQKKTFEATHTELPDGEFINNDDLNKIKTENKELYNVLKDKGFKAAEEVQRQKWLVGNVLLSKPPEEGESIGVLFGNLAKGLFQIGEITDKEAKEWNSNLAQLKSRLGLTEEGIEEARKSYLESSQEAKKAFDFSKFKISHLWRTPELTPEQEKLKEDIDKRLADIRKLPVHKQWVELTKWEGDLTLAGLGTAAATVLPAIRSDLKKKGQDLPKPVRILVEVIGGVAAGAVIAAPLYTTLFVGTLAKTPFTPSPGTHLKETGQGIINFVLSIPAMVAAEPALATGELVGMFVVGPEAALRFMKQAEATVNPAFIPKRGLSVSYSVVRVPKTVLNRTAVTKAVNNGLRQALKDPKGRANVPIGDGVLRLEIRSTPVSEVVGGALYHATPEISPALLKGRVGQPLFTSTQAAPRFADATAGGAIGTNPAIMMIFTRKRGQPRWHPTNNLFRGTKEVEAIFPPGTQLLRVKNLRSRLLGEKSGEFITTHNGKVIKIYRFREPGAAVPTFGIAELAAVRIRAVQAGLADLIKGRKGFKVIKVEDVPTLTRRIVKELDKKKGADLKQLDINKTIDTIVRKEINELTKDNRTGFERLWRERPQRFEGRYLATVGRSLETLRRTPLPQRIYRTPVARQEYEVALERQARGIRRIKTAPREPYPIRAETNIATIRARPSAPRRERIPPRPPVIPVPERSTPREEVPRRIIPPVRRREPREERRAEVRIVSVKKPAVKKAPPITDDLREKATKAQMRGKITWRQGEVTRKGKRVGIWYVIKWPYASRRDASISFGPPKGAKVVKGKLSAFRTIQTLVGQSPDFLLRLDLGIVDIAIDKPTRKPGKPGAIRYKPDPKQRTRGDIVLKQVR